MHAPPIKATAQIAVRMNPSISIAPRSVSYLNNNREVLIQGTSLAKIINYRMVIYKSSVFDYLELRAISIKYEVEMNLENFVQNAKT